MCYELRSNDRQQQLTDKKSRSRENQAGSHLKSTWEETKNFFLQDQNTKKLSRNCWVGGSEWKRERPEQNLTINWHIKRFWGHPLNYHVASFESGKLYTFRNLFIFPLNYQRIGNYLFENNRLLVASCYDLFLPYDLSSEKKQNKRITLHSVMLTTTYEVETDLWRREVCLSLFLKSLKNEKLTRTGLA